MAEALKESRTGLSTYAPRFITHKIAQDKIGTVIGPGGKMIKSIVEKTGVKINIDDDGIVSIMSRDHQAVDDALEIVQNLTRTIEIGETYTGPVKKVMDFGAFVEVFPGTEGLYTFQIWQKVESKKLQMFAKRVILSPLKQPVLTDEVKFSSVSKTSNSENSPQIPYIKLSAHPVSKQEGRHPT